MTSGELCLAAVAVVKAGSMGRKQVRIHLHNVQLYIHRIPKFIHFGRAQSSPSSIFQLLYSSEIFDVMFLQYVENKGADDH